MVADGQLVVAGGDGPVLLEPSDRPLDHVALAITHRIDQGWPATPWSPPRPSRPLVRALGDGVGDPALTQQPPTGRIAVAPISGQVGGALAGPTRPAWARDPDGIQQRLQLGALVPLAGSDQHRQWAATTVAG